MNKTEARHHLMGYSAYQTGPILWQLEASGVGNTQSKYSQSHQ